LISVVPHTCHSRCMKTLNNPQHPTAFSLVRSRFCAVTCTLGSD